MKKVKKEKINYYFFFTNKWEKRQIRLKLKERKKKLKRWGKRGKEQTERNKPKMKRNRTKEYIIKL